MFSPLTPILAADGFSNADTQDVLARIEALAVVLAIVARLAGKARRPAFDALSLRAELSARLAVVPPAETETAARDLATLGCVMQAGLLALEKARAAARLNRAAAALLLEESLSSYHRILATLGHPVTHQP